MFRRPIANTYLFVAYCYYAALISEAESESAFVANKNCTVYTESPQTFVNFSPSTFLHKCLWRKIHRFVEKNCTVYTRLKNSTFAQNRA